VQLFWFIHWYCVQTCCNGQMYTSLVHSLLLCADMLQWPDVHKSGSFTATVCRHAAMARCTQVWFIHWYCVQTCCNGQMYTSLVHSLLLCADTLQWPDVCSTYLYTLIHTITYKISPSMPWSHNVFSPSGFQSKMFYILRT
jgi:hypothetical protein